MPAGQPRSAPLGPLPAAASPVKSTRPSEESRSIDTPAVREISAVAAANDSAFTSAGSAGSQAASPAAASVIRRSCASSASRAS